MPDRYPPYIFGMHDRGGEHLMLGKKRPGWVLVTEALGSDPNNHGGSDYTDLSSQGLGVIARLNNGYGSAGTIPASAFYANFARRCGNFVEASPGCRIWIIGNETNLAAERPGGPQGQTITPQLYASCFRQCRAEIRRRPGHGQDQVVMGAVGPWNTETRYAGNPSGDWIQYFRDVLNLLGDDVDGISLHTYTHGQEPALVFSNATMDPPFQHRHYHFRAYRDFMEAIPSLVSDRPVYITESNQNTAWKNQGSGWVQNAYREINTWNQNRANQPIQALILFRWIIGNPNDPKEVGWAIKTKTGVQNDFRGAMNHLYRLKLPFERPEYLAAWLEVSAPTVFDRGGSAHVSVTIRNDGRRTWASGGSEAVRLGYRWLAADGTSIEGQRKGLPRSVAAGGQVTLPEVSIVAPDRPGFYTLELDLVEGADGWFSEKGSPTWQAINVRVGARYRTAWLQVATPVEGTAGETVTFPVRVRNEGALTWPSSGERPVNLSYKWLDAERNVVVADGLRTSLGRNVAPLEEIALEARVQFPAEPGPYILQMDMVHEFVTWFQWKGSPVHETGFEAQPVVPDYAAEWLDYVGPDRLVLGEQGSAMLTVKNMGTQPWHRSGDGAIRLGYRWFDSQDQEIEVERAQTVPLPHTVESGQTITWRDVAFLGPSQPDAYRLVWDLQLAGEWLSEQGVAILERPIQVVLSEYGVDWEMLEPWAGSMPPDAIQRTRLRLTNTGAKTWPTGGEHPVHVAYTWFTEEGAQTEPWDTYRLQLPEDVASGESVDVDVAFKTPPLLGWYLLRWDLVEEGVSWFFRQGAAPLEVRTKIDDPVRFEPWQAEASHHSEDAHLVFDGDSETFWDSQRYQQPGMWFQVDMGQTLILDRVRVFSPSRGVPAGYQIKLSADGHDWHLVAEKDQNWNNIDEAFAPCTARYVRLEQTGTPRWPSNWMISDISVSATQPWAKAYASHYTDDTSQAWDAQLATNWSTRGVKQKFGMWFGLDMGAKRLIDRVALLHPNNEFPRGYRVQVFVNDQDWLEVGRKNDNWDRLDVRFEPAMTQYVRIELIQGSNYQPWGIAETVVWRTSPEWIRGLGG